MSGPVRFDILRARLEERSRTPREHELVDQVLRGVELAGPGDRHTDARIDFVLDVQSRDADFLAMIGLIVRTHVGDDRPDPSLRIVAVPATPDEAPLRTPRVRTALEVFSAVAQGRYDLARDLLDGPDPRAREATRASTLGLLLQWLAETATDDAAR